MMNLGKLILAVVISFVSFTAFAVDLTQIEQDLNTKGVQGWIHGAVAERGLYVFTYRNPKNFFDYIQMSLVTRDAALQAKLAGFSRQDEVLVKGSFLPNPSPQKHIMVTSIEMVTKYQSKYPSDPYQHEAKIPDELLHINTGTFLVHAIGGDGHILVVEYKDAILPIFVQNSALTKNLFRGDVVQLVFKIQQWPDHPTHLNIDEVAPTPLKVLDSLQALHGKKIEDGKPGTFEGALIMFPKSPEINFNVFAVQQLLQAGLSRQFTLVNMDDPAVFTKIRDVLQAAWDRHPGDYVNGRNKLVSKKIRIKVTSGTFNEVDPSQANAQILLKSSDSFQIIEN